MIVYGNEMQQQLLKNVPSLFHSLSHIHFLTALSIL